ncbi:MAG: preprotein translocase subunit SecE [Dehalococcoidia bacterium]|nr:preprotein translocase subunit SecE [Dehalococcoidia bacterium]
MTILPKAARKDEREDGTGTRSARRPQPAARREVRPQFFREVASELRKVTWPTREQTVNLTVLVIAVSLIVGVVLGAVDWVFLQVIDNMLLGR